MAYTPNDEAPAERPLKAYAFDPSQGRNLGNYMSVTFATRRATIRRRCSCLGRSANTWR